MNNWKQKIEDMYQSKAKRKAEQELTQETQERAENLKAFKNWQERFKCHICSKFPSGPLVIKEQWYGGEIWPEATYWDMPIGMGKCVTCGKWACEDHIYRKVCQKCAERL